jgi:aspartate kinase
MANELTGLQVYKFGGASVKDAAAILNLCRIVRDFGPQGSLLIVVSAMGKTTNALEEIYDLAYHGRDYKDALQKLENFHLATADELLGEPEADEDGETYHPLQQWFIELRQALAAVHPEGNYDQQYDQVVSYGELLASQLVYECLYRQNELPTGVNNWRWHDARRSIHTNDTWREGQVDWLATQDRIDRYYQNDEHASFINYITVTQGFIGGAPDVLVRDAYLESVGVMNWQHRTTTLGREGSDYSAAIFAYCLRAESVTIWKDVPGLLNADPKIFPDTVRYPEISYQETIEMAYYGASVIHPKTLKPLADRKIPLRVKSFLDPAAEGTLIHDCQHPPLAPAFIRKTGQCLLSVESKDFAFISEENLEVIFGVLAQARLKINVMQNSALSFSVCLDGEPARLAQAVAALRTQFKVQYNEGLTLFTIKNYTPGSVAQLLEGRSVLLEQRTRSTFQVVVRE